MLGQMGELGSISAEAHQEVVRAVASLKEVYLVGPEFKAALTSVYGESLPAGIAWFHDSESLAAYIKQHPVKGAVILIKGSRSQEMEKVIPVL